MARVDATTVQNLVNERVSLFPTQTRMSPADLDALKEYVDCEDVPVTTLSEAKTLIESSSVLTADQKRAAGKALDELIEQQKEAAATKEEKFGALYVLGIALVLVLSVFP